EIGWGTRLAGCVVRAMHAVFEKRAEPRIAAAGLIRTADLGRRQCATDTGDGIVVQLLKVGLGSLPVTNVRFIPDFPVPLLNFLLAILFDAVLGPLINQLAPFPIVRRRKGPAGVNGAVVLLGAELMLIGLRMGRERLGHEADFHVWPHSALAVGV